MGLSGAMVYNRSQQTTITKGEMVMGATGKKDKGGKEERKKPKLSIKEKRKLKNEKKSK
jgi:hypothetical protein